MHKDLVGIGFFLTMEFFPIFYQKCDFFRIAKYNADGHITHAHSPL
jgi:hypothetical protein